MAFTNWDALKNVFRILINAGLDNFKPERMPDTSVAVIELAG